MAATGGSGIIHIDGGSRGNPGPAGYGFIVLRDGQPPLRGNGRLGHATNNVAEYTGLIRGLEKALELGLSDVLVRSDSELLVRQMNGEYRVKNEQLQELFAQAKALARQIGSVRFAHVYREQNAEADRLANLAMDGELVESFDPTETLEQPVSPPAKRPSLREALRKKKEAEGETPQPDAWSRLAAAFTELTADAALAEKLVAAVKAAGFRAKG